MAWLLRPPDARGRRRVAFVILGLYGIVGLLIPVGDNLNLSAASAESAKFQYSIISFETSNFLDKWTHRIYAAMPWTDTSEASRARQLDEYLELVPLIRDAGLAITEASSRAAPAVIEVRQKQAELDRLLAERDRLRDGVEEYLESAISKTLDGFGLGAWGDLVWPPVDFRIDNPPRVLVISPRTEIKRVETILIDPDIPADEIERIERRLLEQSDLSAVILLIGGLALYPTIVPSDRDLLPLLEVAAHEWIHAYLIFYPLGRAFFQGGDMVTLNETLADIVGDEIGGETWSALTGQPAPERSPPPAIDLTPEAQEPDEFDFFRFMRETRARADDLLAENDVEGAEEWMELRRLELQDHGVHIRKINQAYFAFNGSYGDSGSSVSPIAGQLWALRAVVPGAGDFLRAVRGVSSVAQFEAVLTEYGADVPE